MVSRAQTHLRLVAAQEPERSHGPTDAVSDMALLAALQRRDRSASADFYQRARPIIDRTLTRLVGRRDADYEDVAQAALYEVVSTSGRFRGECPLDAWLSIVSARVAYRHIRRRRLERRFFARPLEEPLQSVSPVAFAARQAIDKVRTHLGRMDAKRAWAFLLHDVYGYELEQVGEIMGSSMSAAQSRLVRGRRELHERIGKDRTLAGLLDELPEEP